MTYECVCICVYTGAYVYAHAYGSQRLMSGGFSNLSSLHFLRFSLNVEVSVGLGWPASEFQSSV